MQPFTVFSPNDCVAFSNAPARLGTHGAHSLTRRTLNVGCIATLALPTVSTSHDLLVVGPGVLGGYLGKLWKDTNAGSSVVGLTNTTNSHDRQAWVRMGLPIHN